MMTSAFALAAAASTAAARRRALLLEARKQRVAWLQDEEYEEVDVVQALMTKQQQEQQQPSSQTKRGTLTGLFEAVPGLDDVLPAAREYVGFLNELAGEGDREAIEYALDTLSSTEEKEGEDEEGAEGEEAPPLPDLAVNATASLSYEDFVWLLAHPGSAEVVKSMQRFVTAFIQSQERRKGMPALPPSSPSAPRPQGQHLHAFIKSLRSQMCKSEVWAARLTVGGKLSSSSASLSSSSSSSTSSSTCDELREHLEKFLVIKLHRYLFTESESHALSQQETSWQARLHSLAFLSPEHLEVRSLLSSSSSPSSVPSSTSQALSPAIAELSLVPSHKAPADIMSCLLRCSHRLSQALIAAHPPGTGLPGADEFLPAMILMIKESNPPGLRKALEIVQFYRYPPRLQVSEPAYVFTNVMSAVHFLETAEASQLNMTNEVFKRSLAACSASMRMGRRVMASGGGEGGGGGGGGKGGGGGEEEEGEVLSVSSSLQNLTLGRVTSLSSSSFLSPSLVVGNGTSNNNKSNGANVSQQPPARSIQNIRRERMAGAAVAKVAFSTSTAAVPPSLPPSSPSSLRLQDVADALQSRHCNSSSSSSNNQGKHRQSAEAQSHLLLQSLSSQQLEQACSFLTASPQDLRVSDVSALLAEYRCLATVAGECLNSLQQQRK